MIIIIMIKYGGCILYGSYHLFDILINDETLSCPSFTFIKAIVHPESNFNCPFTSRARSIYWYFFRAREQFTRVQYRCVKHTRYFKEADDFIDISA